MQAPRVPPLPPRAPPASVPGLHGNPTQIDIAPHYIVHAGRAARESQVLLIKESQTCSLPIAVYSLSCSHALSLSHIPGCTPALPHASPTS